MADQRGPRQLLGVLSTRTLTLRAALSRENEDQEAREIVRYKVEELKRKGGEKQKEREKRSRQETEPEQVEPDEAEEDDMGIVCEEEEQCDDSDSEWEDLEETSEQKESNKYNTIGLKNFARECDRYGVSDRAGAKIGNGLLKDLGIVKKGSTDKLICPGKLRRERSKWGAVLERKHSAVELPQGLYTDGKRVPTLVRRTTETKVRIPGRRGRGAYRTVVTTSNKVEIQDHYPVLAQPGGDYVTHVTPEDGTGMGLAKELVAVIRERRVSKTRYNIRGGVYWPRQLASATRGDVSKHCWL